MFKININNLNNFKKKEKKIYLFWEQNNYFKPKLIKNKKNFCIVIPPPNITGNLHIGHALQQTIIDISARYNRMNGKNVLLKTGTDHAGIATQIIILKKNKNKKKKNSNNLLIKKTILWKNKIINIINNQIRRLGISVDLSEKIFTMDSNFTKAVKKIFINLFEQKIIYKKKKLVNWNTKLKTVVSDLEIKYKVLKGYIWYIKYPLQKNLKTLNNKPYIIVATTRPETILGDTALAVNPIDKRYQNLIGKKAIIPLVNRYITIIADKYVNINKGTGCVKITPGHDFNDYEIAKKHNLEILNILKLDGKILNKSIITGKKKNKYINFIPKKFRNLNLYNARKLIILNLKLLGCIKKKNKTKINIPYSDRQNIIIEPMLTDQWFLKSKILSKNAIKIIKEKKIKFLLKKYENMYFSWMKNIQDWCISRQLWWGHRIPAWYDKNGKIYVGNNEEEIKLKYKINNNIILRQDNDVLDTWFSSSLWTFVTLGWLQKKNMLCFHPTNIIFSGFDIIFFWIARMIMLTIFFIKDKNGKPQIPFKFIYITGLICDINKKKMSKSKGNIIDPIDIIEGISLKNLYKKRLKNITNKKKILEIKQLTKKQFSNDIKPYGADVLRLFLSNISNTNRCILLNFKQIEKCQNFYNKLLNAFKFIIIYYKTYNSNKNNNINNNINKFLLIDRYIQIKLNIVIKDYCISLNNYRFDIAVNIIYKFIWNEFCNWYIEFSKIILKYGNLNEKFSNYYTLFYIFNKILRLLHPIMPFITENIWQIIKKINNSNNNTIMLKSFPKYNLNIYNKKDIDDLKWIKNIITSIRNIKLKMKIKNKKKIKIFFWNINKNIIKLINNNKKIIIKMTYLKNIEILYKKKKKPICLIKIIDGNEILFPLKFINKNIELNYIIKKIQNINKQIFKIKLQLNNKSFLINAPKKIINKKKKVFLNINKNKNKLLKQFIILK